MTNMMLTYVYYNIIPGYRAGFGKIAASIFYKQNEFSRIKHISSMSQSRQLAAIMFTDIVGYTALMGEDEQKAFEILRKNRQLQKANH